MSGLRGAPHDAQAGRLGTRPVALQKAPERQRLDKDRRLFDESPLGFYIRLINDVQMSIERCEYGSVLIYLPTERYRWDQYGMVCFSIL